MKKQILYLSLIPRLFSTTLDLLLLSVITPYIEIPLYKSLYNFFFHDFSIFPVSNNDSFPYDHTLKIKEFYSYLQSTNKLNTYFIFLSLIFFIKFIVVGAYFVSMWYYTGTTFGKMLLKMKIVDAENFTKPSLSQLIKRYLGLLLAPIGLWMIIFNKKKQSLYDKIANTVVIKS